MNKVMYWEVDTAIVAVNVTAEQWERIERAGKEAERHSGYGAPECVWHRQDARVTAAERMGVRLETMEGGL